MPEDTAVAEGISPESSTSAQTTTTGDSAQSSTKSDSTAGSSAVDWDTLLKNPEARDRIKAMLDSDDDLKEHVVKPVRKSEISRRAQEEAKKMRDTDPEFATLKSELERAKASLTDLTRRQEAEMLSKMSTDEQAVFKLYKQLEGTQAENKELKSWRTAREEERAKDDILKYAREKLKLDEDDIDTVASESSAERLVFKLMEVSADKREKESKTGTSAMEVMKARLDAMERQLSGESTHASGTPSGSGGDLEGDDLIDAYLRTPSSDPGYSKIAARYQEYAKKQGWA